MGHSKIHKEKKKIDKLAHFCSKVNTFINTRLTNNETVRILDTVAEINEKIMHDKKYLNLNSDPLSASGMKASNSVLFNNPLMPGHTMAWDGKKTRAVVNPLGSAALGMGARNMENLSLSYGEQDLVKAQANNVLAQDMPQQDMPNLAMAMPMRIDTSKQHFPPEILTGGPILNDQPQHFPPHILNPTPMLVPGPAPPPVAINQFVPPSGMSSVFGAVPPMGVGMQEMTIAEPVTGLGNPMGAMMGNPMMGNPMIGGPMGVPMGMPMMGGQRKIKNYPPVNTR